MALAASKTPLFRTIASRSYSQAAAPLAGTLNYDVKSTVLPNKIVVASADNNSSIARVSIAFRAGSRYESYDNKGATHVIRIACGLSTANNTQFSLMRNLQQAGASISCTTNRETIIYTLEGTRRAVQSFIPILTDVAANQVFKPWELEDNAYRLKIDLATRDLQIRTLDLLHRAAFRRGLGNSLFITKHNISKINSETLRHFVASNFKSNRTAVIGLGVDHTELVHHAQSLSLESGPDDAPSSKYKSGEIRSDKGGDLVYVAIAGEGGSMKNLKEAAAFKVLRRALGAGPSVKYGTESQSVLSKAVGNTSEPHSINSIAASYSDTGLFGVLCVGSSAVAQKLVEASYKTIKTARVTDADVARGKQQYKLQVLDHFESGANAMEFISHQAVLSGAILSPMQYVQTIDSVTTADVDAALKKLQSSKLTIAAVGNMEKVPFLDEIH